MLSTNYQYNDVYLVDSDSDAADKNPSPECGRLTHAGLTEFGYIG